MHPFLDTLCFLSFMAGAVHVLAPDHWFPLSVLSWQRQWGGLRALGFAFIAFLLHLLLGVSIYFLFFRFFSQVGPETLFFFTLVLLFGSLLIRLSRFSRLEEVLRSSRESRWSFFAAISLLGPCESLIPVLIKAKLSGTGYLLPFLSFFAGTLIAGLVLIGVGRWIWNRPLYFSRSLAWAYQRTATVPVVIVLIIGLSALFRVG